MTLAKAKEQDGMTLAKEDGMTLAKVKEQDGMTHARVIPTLFSCFLKNIFGLLVTTNSIATHKF